MSSEEGDSALPDHDMELTFDWSFDLNDLQLVCTPYVCTVRQSVMLNMYVVLSLWRYSINLFCGKNCKVLSILHYFVCFQINRIRMSINLALSHERNSETLLKIQRKARQLLLEYVTANCPLPAGSLILLHLVLTFL